MPSKEQHIKQYNKNKSLANTECLKRAEYKDWRIVVVYYAALHCIDSSYAQYIHPKTHKDRKEYMKQLGSYDPILDDYDNLEMLSRKSRYKCVEIKEREVTDALINLSTIEDFIKSKNNSDD